MILGLPRPDSSGLAQLLRPFRARIVFYPDPGAARYALAPGYYMLPLRGWIGARRLGRHPVKLPYVSPVPRGYQQTVDNRLKIKLVNDPVRPYEIGEEQFVRVEVE